MTDLRNWSDPPPQSYALETELKGATLSRLTQRIVLAGSDAAEYAQQIEGSFGADLPGGIERIAEAIARAAAAPSAWSIRT